jgi:hypothetical protein
VSRQSAGGGHAAVQISLQIYEFGRFVEPKRNVQGRVGSIACEFLPRHLCIVMYKAPGDTPAEDWSSYIDFIEAHAHYGSRLKLVVHNEDGGTSFEQQARLGPLLRTYQSRVAVISGAERLRTMVSIVSAWNPNLKLFGTGEFDDVFDHLQSDQDERDAIEAAFERLRAKVGR